MNKDGFVSIALKQVVVVIDDKQFDISHLVSDDVWNMGNSLNPVDRWMIMTEVGKIAQKFVGEQTGSPDVRVTIY